MFNTVHWVLTPHLHIATSLNARNTLFTNIYPYISSVVLINMHLRYRILSIMLLLYDNLELYYMLFQWGSEVQDNTYIFMRRLKRHEEFGHVHHFNKYTYDREILVHTYLDICEITIIRSFAPSTLLTAQSPHRALHHKCDPCLKSMCFNDFC